MSKPEQNTTESYESPEAFASSAIVSARALRLNDIAEAYLGMSPVEANRRASKGLLPFPTFRAIDSQKSPRLLHVEDFLRHLDTVASTSRAQWVRSQVAL